MAVPVQSADASGQVSDRPALDAWLTMRMPTLNDLSTFGPSVSPQSLLEADPFLLEEPTKGSYSNPLFDDASYRHRELAAGLVSRHVSGSRTSRLRLVDRLSDVFQEFDSPATYVRIRTLLRSDVWIDRIFEAFELKLYWKEAAHLCLYRKYDKSLRRWQIYTKSSGYAHEISWKNSVMILELMSLDQAIDLLDGSWREQWQYLHRGDFSVFGTELPDWFYSFPSFVVHRINQFRAEFQLVVSLDENSEPVGERRELLKHVEKTYGLNMNDGLILSELMGRASTSDRGSQK